MKEMQMLNWSSIKNEMKVRKREKQREEKEVNELLKENFFAAVGFHLDLLDWMEREGGRVKDFKIASLRFYK
jgi:hypothetical protein